MTFAEADREIARLRAEIDHLRADRDCEKRLRKDSDDLVTDLRLALGAVLANPADTVLAHTVLRLIHGGGDERLT